MIIPHCSEPPQEPAVDGGQQYVNMIIIVSNNNDLYFKI